MKIVFDASVHFGQFSLDSEATRIGCKNSQARLSSKPSQHVAGIITHEENSWVDRIVWQQTRSQQDIFYPFMDVFHTIQNVSYVSADDLDPRKTRLFAKEFSISQGAAQTCEAAVLIQAEELHTCYPQLVENEKLKKALSSFGIKLVYPADRRTRAFADPALETCYQTAFSMLQEQRIDLLKILLTAKSQ